MSDALTFAEIDSQYVELLPARPLQVGGAPIGDGTGGPMAIESINVIGFGG